MAAFKRTNVKNFAKVNPQLTEESIYWKKYTQPVLVKEFGPIDYIDFLPAEPHYFAVTCSSRVQIYNPITKLATKNFSNFKEAAYGGSFRSDGKLLCAGGREADVKLFDVTSKSLLRVFTGHKAAVHRTFFTKSGHQIASFSDDKTVSVWDIATEKQIVSFNQHNDYIRAGAVSPISPDLILSGGYDKIVNMYDTRTNKTIFTVNHDSPVESIIFLPTGGVFISAGGTEMRVWDALAGGKLIAKVSQHHKTITCLHIASNGNRILSGSLDRHVKVYQVGTYKPLHTFDYSNAVLSVGISADDETIVAGLVDGLISVRRREENIKEKETPKPKKISYHRAGQNFSSTVDVVIGHVTKPVMGKYDKFLRKFEYTQALDSVLKPYITQKTPHVTVALLQELTRRQGLRQALAGRNEKSLVKILTFLSRNIGNARFGRVILHVSDVLIDVYEDSIDEMGADVRRMFKHLAEKLQEEEDIAIAMAELQGALHMLLSGAETRPEAIPIKDSLNPSDKAKENLIHSVS